MINSWFVKISLQRRHTLMVEDDAFSHKMDYILNFEGHLTRNFGSKFMAEWVDFAYWRSFIGKGLCLQPD